MSAERNDTSPPKNYIRIVSRNDAISPPSPEFRRLTLVCPDLQPAIDVFTRIQTKNPQFMNGEMYPILAFSLYMDNPYTIKQSAKIFNTTEKTVRKWIDLVIDEHEHDWELFEQTLTRKKQRLRRKYPVFNPPSPSQPLPLIQHVLSPKQMEALQLAQNQENPKSIPAQRQHLSLARDKIATALLYPEGYIKIASRNYELTLAAQLGKIEAAQAIAGVWYAPSESLTRYKQELEKAKQVIPIPIFDSDIAVEGKKPRQPRKRVNPFAGRKYPEKTIYDKPQKPLV